MKKLIATFASLAMLIITPNCNVHALPDDFTPPDFDYREVSEDTTEYLDEFMELSLEELSAVVPYDNGKRLDSYDPIGFDVYLSGAEVSEMLDVLAQQQGDDTDYSNNKKVFCDYLLDRMHLKGIFEAWALEEIDYLTGIELSSLRAVEDNIPFREVEVAEDSHLVWVYAMPPMMFYPVEYQGQTIWMEWKEFFMRMLYTARTYGEVYFYPAERLLDDTAYTFEQLLTMERDEIVSISDVCASAYTEAEAAYLDAAAINANATPIHIVFIDDSSYALTDENGNVVAADSAKILEDVKLPAELIKSAEIGNKTFINDQMHQEYTLYIKINSEKYLGHDMSDVYIRAYIALLLNPDILFARIENSGVVPENTETTTTVTTASTTTTTAPTTTAGGVATGDASVMYLLFAGIGAAAVGSIAKRRKDTSA